MTEKRTHASGDDARIDQESLSAQANDELAVMEHASAFDDPIALEHDALAASAEEDRASERRLRPESRTGQRPSIDRAVRDDRRGRTLDHSGSYSAGDR